MSRGKGCTEIPPLLVTEILSTNTYNVNYSYKIHSECETLCDLNHYFYLHCVITDDVLQFLPLRFHHLV